MQQQMEKYIEYLFSLALQKSGNFADAEDLAQDVLLAAYAYMDKGGIIQNMKAWLSGTLNHKYYDMLRKMLPDCKIGLPKHLEGRIARFRQYSFGEIPMAVIKKAIVKGDFLKNRTVPAPPMVLVVEEEESDGMIK